MQATRILPDLQCSLLCEEVRQEANGNLFLIGVINFIRVPQLPIVAGRLLRELVPATRQKQKAGKCDVRDRWFQRAAA